MTQDSERPAAESDRDDRLSSLPRNIIDCILELLPVEDAARTSILSRKWRYIWAMLPSLVLDECFREELGNKKKSVFKDTIDQILLQHIGDIVKFVLDVPGAHLSSDTIDRWMLYVTRHGVKELTLNMSNNSTYKLPSYIFNCPTLTDLKLSNCVFKPPNSFLSFQNLKSLYLEKITFVPTTEFCVIQAPLLVKLIMWFSNGFDRSTLEKLLLSLPRLKVLLLDSFFLQLLSADLVPKGLPFTLHSMSLLYLLVDLRELGQTSCAVELIKCSPNLSNLVIWVVGSNNAEAVLKYLDRPACLDRPLNKLEDVTVHFFEGSKAELHFVKLLFARSPSLLRMSIEQSELSGSSRQERNNIITELMRFRRASPKAELIYLPNEN